MLIGALRRAALSVALLLGGCGLLDTDTPNIIEPGNLDSPEGATARYLGAIRDFGFVKDGDGSQVDTEGLVLISGDMSDEFMHSGFIPSMVEFDQRIALENNGSLSDVYLQLHRARVAAEGAAVSLAEHSPDPAEDTRIPEILSLAGFTYIYFGENFCSAVPYSQAEGDNLILGRSETTQETLLRAVARFDLALALPAAALDPDIANLAAVGKGRALLNLGDFTNAGLAVAAVPTTFQYVTEHDPAPLSLANAVFVFGISPEDAGDGGSISVADVEGTTGLPYRTADDPRVPFFDTGHNGLDQETPQFDVLKYPDPASSIVTADGIEARLIEAEVELQAENFSAMTAILNDLRQAIDPVPTDLPDPATRDEAIDQLFLERALWLYATGHRLGDMRRLVRQYGRTVDTVFPVGDYLRGGSYGDKVNLPVPTDEEANPQFVRSQCDATAA